jgi:hypothetical protein
LSLPSCMHTLPLCIESIVAGLHRRSCILFPKNSVGRMGFHRIPIGMSLYLGRIACSRIKAGLTSQLYLSIALGIYFGLEWLL